MTKTLIIGFFVVMILILSNVKALSQREPMYSQYMFNKLIYNPACAGTESKSICATLLLQNYLGSFFGTGDEYIGLAPSNQTLSINTPFQNSNILGGFGLVATRDKMGYEYMTTTGLSMSFKRNFSFGTIQLGLNGGVVQKGLNSHYSGPYSEMKPILPDFGTGIYLFSQNKYFIGLSFHHLIEGQFNWGNGNSTEFLERLAYITAGYNYIFSSNPKFELQPSFLYRIERTKQQFEINANLTYNKMFWGGLGYRQGDAMTLLLGMKLKNVQFGYSLDLITTSLNMNSTHTQEILLNYCIPINKSKKN